MSLQDKKNRKPVTRGCYPKPGEKPPKEQLDEKGRLKHGTCRP